ncbi:MAG: AAA family ATPase, partial [Eggerthellaceae bacterium]|nr:AAA family ATPase [Eggerthellaceae bacterium]
MYLKSLVLKGFKSFADRSVLNLQPGITAVVGPNGSGKSNISDAVLWVLGERNARNLRGQAMEDVIFAGSAARKPVSVAEVELVLDNSDGTLPVEYDEVSIARRMYRSGESEYLINGVVSRRLDVLDILHDSGLGTGTHSIISQGSLDSILQSKPEDRRALIEEAAGVLKHKQRKEKSARKLAQMDNHLARVHDVVAEVERQLGPLERKAKRAKAYAEASDELSQLRLSLAVDDLRKLKSEWERVCAEETNVSGMVDERRVQVDAAEKRVGDLQELILRESEDAGELARKQRKAASVAERLDSVDMLVREKRRAAQSYVADMEIALESADAKRIGAQEALNAAKVQSEQAEAAYREAQDDADKLSKERYDAAERRREVESRVENAEAELRKLSDDLENAKRSHAEMQELLSNGLAHQKLVDARRTEMQGLLTRATQEHEEAKEALAQKEESLAQMQQRDTEAQKGASEAYARREQAHAQSDAAKRAVKATEAEINAVVQARRAHDAEVPALIWLVDHAADFAGNLAPVAQALKAPADMETMVERLLGEDLSALAVEDANCAETVVSALVDGARVGDVSLVMRKSGRLAQREDARSCQIGHALVDDLTFADSAREVVCARLGDVVVCDSRAQAFDAHSKDAYGLRFVSRDGLVIYPNGKMRVYGAVEGKREGVLARERKLDQLRKRLDEEIKNEAAAAQDAEAADESYREAQEESLHVSQSLAELKGAVQAARDAEKSASERVSSLVREATEIERQLEVAAKTVA